MPENLSNDGSSLRLIWFFTAPDGNVLASTIYDKLHTTITINFIQIQCYN